MSDRKVALKVLFRKRSACLSVMVLLLWIVLASLPQFFPALQEIEIDLPKTRLPPRFEIDQPLGWMGYDAVGGSVLLHVLNGAQVSLLVSLLTVICCLVLGIPLGTFAALSRGWGDALVSRLMEVLLSFPPLVLPIAITAMLGGGLVNTILALSLAGWVGTAKLVRGEVRALSQREFVEAARALGASSFRIAVSHLLPLIIIPVLIHSVFSIAGIVLAEAGLSFLGLGMGEGYISWGTLLSEGRSYLLESPHLVIFPSIALLSLVFSLNFLADSLRLVLSPKAGAL